LAGQQEGHSVNTASKLLGFMINGSEQGIAQAQSTIRDKGCKEFRPVL